MVRGALFLRGVVTVLLQNSYPCNWCSAVTVDVFSAPVSVVPHTLSGCSCGHCSAAAAAITVAVLKCHYFMLLSVLLV